MLYSAEYKNNNLHTNIMSNTQCCTSVLSVKKNVVVNVVNRVRNGIIVGT